MPPVIASDADNEYQMINSTIVRAHPHRAADKGYDADERVIERLEAQGKTAVIPPKRNRKPPREYDRELYKARHLIENFFAKLKPYRGIATRYDKLGEAFLSAIDMAASVIWLI